MNTSSLLAFIVPTLVLLLAVVSDLRFKKVSNNISLSVLAATTVFHFAQYGWGDWQGLLLSTSLAFVLMLPLVAARILGAGDLKIFVALAPAVVFVDIFWIYTFSIIWAGVLGLMMAVVRGELRTLLTNTYMLMSRVKPESKTLHKIPYTVAMLFGWLSVVTLNSIGGL